MSLFPSIVVHMKLAEWARQNGVHPQTAYRWVREGRMPVPVTRTPSGTILVQPLGTTGETAAIYARVPSAKYQAELQRQVARLSVWAAKEGLHVVKVETEVASAGRSRARLRRLLADPDITVVVVETPDRVSPLAAELVEAALSAAGRCLAIVEPDGRGIGLDEDFESAAAWFATALDGGDGAKGRARRATVLLRESQ
jgi:putative resolvase